jgi:hypothetical protein
VVGAAGTYDALGYALAAGNFDGDYFDDLAIGVPGDRLVSAGVQDGSVVVLFGESVTGLTNAGQQRVDRELLGEFAAGQNNSQFGAALAAGDLDPDWSCAENQTCADDLVVGARNAEVGGAGSAGLVYALFGSWAGEGLAVDSHLEISQLVFDGGVGTAPEVGDRFGSAVAVGSLSDGARADFAAGTPVEGQSGLTHTGCVHVGHHVAPGFDTVDNPEAEFLSARTGFASAPLQQGAELGVALAIGDFNGDGWGDLAIGVDGFQLAGVGSVGAVQILYGALFADGFESDTSANWSSH